MKTKQFIQAATEDLQMHDDTTNPDLQRAHMLNARAHVGTAAQMVKDENDVFAVTYIMHRILMRRKD